MKALRAAKGAAAATAADAAPPSPRRRRRRRALAPSVWRTLRILLVLLILAAAYGAYALNGTPQGQALLAATEDQALAATASLGLVVEDIEVEGRKTTDAATIKAALAADRGTPIFAVSPSRAQRQLESLPWVRSATIERRLPSTLLVRLVEREPLALWQHDGKIDLIDRQGEVIAVKDVGRFDNLPMVVGDDAAPRAAALIDMLAKEPDLAARVSVAVRVDDRRWNLRIDHTIDVMLPEENPADAWTHLAELERTKKLLQRDLQSVDMRLPDRLVLRVTAAAPSAGAIREASPAKKPHPGGKNT